MASMIETHGDFAGERAPRGYRLVYREHEVNHCPGCSRTHWYVGRTMAECAFCETALPLGNSVSLGASGVPVHVRGPIFDGAAHAFAA